jgi:hypothetical protein
MCNLYSITTNQAAITALFRVLNRYVGNLPPMPGVFPDYSAPVVRNAGTERELTMMRWGMPPPPRTGGPPVTNVRNTASPHWRGWLKPENRCLVPANSFAEYAPEPNPETKKKDVVWFGLNEDRPLFAIAGRECRDLARDIARSEIQLDLDSLLADHGFAQRHDREGFHRQVVAAVTVFQKAGVAIDFAGGCPDHLDVVRRQTHRLPLKLLRMIAHGRAACNPA